MGRSLKKGPFVDEHLMKKVEAQANDEKKKVTLLQFMTDVNTYLFTSKKTW